MSFILPLACPRSVHQWGITHLNKPKSVIMVQEWWNLVPLMKERMMNTMMLVWWSYLNYICDAGWSRLTNHSWGRGRDVKNLHNIIINFSDIVKLLSLCFAYYVTQNESDFTLAATFYRKWALSSYLFLNRPLPARLKMDKVEWNWMHFLCLCILNTMVINIFFNIWDTNEMRYFFRLPP